MAQIKVDGELIEVPDHYTLMQAAEAAGAEIPRFCYHERLSVAGNCRMCLIEVKGGPPKPQASCAMGVKDLRPGPNGEPPEIFTNTPMVKKAREGVMEFLLINHPLDCPICDQGGECDLQDQSMAYGIDASRYKENKRAVEDKYIGPLVKTVMTRCIHCTRCVRFTTEVAGISELGLVGRGEDAEITTYLEKAMTSEMQGNVIDLCPVGALTSKPYAFTARPWELTKTETIDVMDAVGSNIRVDSRGREVMRIVPRTHEGVNEEWISDKTRFIWDGLRSQRLDRPYVRKRGKLVAVEWDEALKAAGRAMKSAKKVAGLVGDLASTEAAYSLKQLVTSLGGNVECRTDGAKLPIGNRSAYVGNAKIADIDTADMMIMIGANPRIEAPVLNARLRKAWLRGARLARIGAPADLNYAVATIGEGSKDVVELAGFDHSEKHGVPGVMIVGQGALTGPDGDAVLSQAMKAADKAQSKLLVLHTAASRVGAMDVGAVTEGGIEAALEGADVIVNLGADEIEIGSGPFVIYVGSHGDRGAHRADVILPSAAYTEESGTFVNTEGRPQLAQRAVFAPGEAKENWAVLRALSAEAGKAQGWNSLTELRSAMYAAHPHLAEIDVVPDNGWKPIPVKKPANAKFANAISDFYMTNPIARASAVMGECAQIQSGLQQAAE
ncbi:MAG: NADH-quinone oxidoreductase subunit G [Hyphomicrobiaceae bacterium]|nr:NADH-quinone oxidoreductase subunit G [Hyphomicrobiaceae bacterium]